MMIVRSRRVGARSGTNQSFLASESANLGAVEKPQANRQAVLEKAKSEAKIAM